MNLLYKIIKEEATIIGNAMKHINSKRYWNISTVIRPNANNSDTMFYYRKVSSRNTRVIIKRGYVILTPRDIEAYVGARQKIQYYRLELNNLLKCRIIDGKEYKRMSKLLKSDSEMILLFENVVNNLRKKRIKKYGYANIDF